MKVQVDVRELIVEGLPEADRTAFGQRLREELSVRLGADKPDFASGHVESFSTFRKLPLERATDAAPEVARAVQRGVSK